MFHSFKYRSTETEVIDDFNFKGYELETTLDFIEWINKRLGGLDLLRSAFKKALEYLGNPSRPLQIVDLGCGGGDGLRAISLICPKESRLLGIDANPHVISYAIKRTAERPNLKYYCGNIFDDPPINGADIIICGLFLHHFTFEEIRKVIHMCKERQVSLLIVNDLQRHWLPYRLFLLVCRVFRAPDIARIDGALSVRKGFVYDELEKLMKECHIQKYHLKWRWAFRYELIADLR